ncbi:MAG TPA: NAD(P)(+) transhydrogenase (Re/Si-specific) subunit beta [Bacteroidetes bacterium]|nr:NAD(P)(+) transhydrogenase (Re/Si-specific) subunit beta [Bacteroidota bacterium]
MENITYIAYLISAVCFILGLKKLSSAKTARQGNILSGIGMLIAIAVTLLDKQIIDFTFIIAGIVVGSAIGAIAAKKVKMTDMPQMVAVFNGFGGGASTLVALAEFYRFTTTPEVNVSITLVLSLLIGTVTFTGSFIAFAKLQGLMKSAPVVFKMQQFVNILLFLAIVVLGVLFVIQPSSGLELILVIAISAVLGLLLVIPIGGADMPVVIALLNSYSGLAAAMTGFVLNNYILIISGALVGASGIILSNLMCIAMNRSLINVLFGKVGFDASAGGGEKGERKQVTRYTPDDAVMMLENAGSVIIVPGYGLAVAQAQHVLQEMASLLEKNGTEVHYAIHPVAGRMPGHMNVLLAEANVPYDKLMEMDAINEDFQNTDVALVIGANDVINPAARTKKDSVLYGMPILNVDQARTVIIVKRSLNPGFAGEDNELFYGDKTMMVFGDAKKIVTDIANLLKG